MYHWIFVRLHVRLYLHRPTSKGTQPQISGPSTWGTAAGQPCSVDVYLNLLVVSSVDLLGTTHDRRPSPSDAIPLLDPCNPQQHRTHGERHAFETQIRRVPAGQRASDRTFFMTEDLQGDGIWFSSGIAAASLILEY